MGDKDNHYVDNEKLVEEILKYKVEYEAWKELDDESIQRPAASNYVGEAILLTATKVAQMHNFSRYTYKDEMISDSIENVLRYLHNFDTERSNNAFSYITQIIYYAFIRRIKIEKKQAYIIYELIGHAGNHGLYDAIQNKNALHDKDPQRAFIDYVQISVNDIDKFTEESAPKERKKRKKKLKTVPIDQYAKDPEDGKSTDNKEE